VDLPDLDPITYTRRVADDEIDALFGSLAAVSIEGAKAVGKTATALQRARTVYRLDDDDQRSLIQADRSRLLEGERPILIDEWQRLPASWDIVRREVDKPRTPAASFLLTGQRHPRPTPTRTPAPAESCRSGCAR
jgi:predicted AAA+ superfamily ATPase